MRVNAFIQTVVPVAFGLGFFALGIGAFIRLGNSQQQLEGKLQSIRSGTILPDTLVVVQKYRDPGKAGLPHVVFRTNRLPKVSIAVTRDLFNSLNLGDTIPGYYFPDGYFLPQNQRGDAATGRWFFLVLAVLLGGGAFALAWSRARTTSQ